jgi:hypothetical protein
MRAEETCSSASQPQSSRDSPLYANSLPAGMRRTCSPKTMGVKRRIWTFGYAGSRNGTSLNSQIILALKREVHAHLWSHCSCKKRGACTLVITLFLQKEMCMHTCDHTVLAKRDVHAHLWSHCSCKRRGAYTLVITLLLQKRCNHIFFYRLALTTKHRVTCAALTPDYAPTH